MELKHSLDSGNSHKGLPILRLSTACSEEQREIVVWQRLFDAERSPLQSEVIAHVKFVTDSMSLCYPHLVILLS